MTRKEQELKEEIKLIEDVSDDKLNGHDNRKAMTTKRTIN